jgi:ribonuclease R
MGEHCSMTERRADDATRDVADWLKCEYMLDHVGDEFDGVIASVTGFGFFVRLAEIHIDGLVHVSTLTNDYYQFDPLHMQLIGENFRRRYRLGDKVRVKVMGVNLDDRKIDFVMVEAPLTGKDGKEVVRKPAKGGQRHDKRKEGKDTGKSDKGGRAKPSNRRPSKKARDKVKSTK